MKDSRERLAWMLWELESSDASKPGYWYSVVN